MRMTILTQTMVVEVRIVLMMGRVVFVVVRHSENGDDGSTCTLHTSAHTVNITSRGWVMVVVVVVVMIMMVVVVVVMTMTTTVVVVMMTMVMMEGDGAPQHPCAGTDCLPHTTLCRVSKVQLMMMIVVMVVVVVVLLYCIQVKVRFVSNTYLFIVNIARMMMMVKVMMMITTF